VKPRPQSAWLQLSGIGFEVAAVVGGGALVGYWFDRHFKSAPWGLLVGCTLGLVSGLYRLIRGTMLSRVETASPPYRPGAKDRESPTASDEDGQAPKRGER
jgi:F0F1-type ATP synthase assembly protein I